MSQREIVTKGDLPYWYMPGAAHFVTYRLVDTLPVEVLKRLRAERDDRLRRSTLAASTTEIGKRGSPGKARWTLSTSIGAIQGRTVPKGDEVEQKHDHDGHK